MRIIIVSIFLIFVVIFPGRTSPSHPSDQASNQVSEENEEKETPTQGFCGSDFNSIVWQDLMIIPVQFTAKNKENTVFSGFFSSKFFFDRMEFKLLPGMEAKFFVENDGWEEEVGQKQFIKKFKKNFWLVIYLQSQGNAICQAHQFKSLDGLATAFAQEPQNIVGPVDNPAFWKNLRMKPVMFIEIKGSNAYWVSLEFTSNPWTEKDDEKFALENGAIARRRLNGVENDGRITGHGVFKIHKNCVFHIMETRPPKIKIRGYALLGKTRTRTRAIGQDYFLKNSMKYFWFCFYDKDSKTVVRMIEMRNHDFQEEKKNGKKTKENRAKQTKTS